MEAAVVVGIVVGLLDVDVESSGSRVSSPGTDVVSPGSESDGRAAAMVPTDSADDMATTTAPDLQLKVPNTAMHHWKVSGNRY